MNDKYKLFKNFMHNELGISKEDIHEWVRETIKEEIKNIVEHAYGKCNIESEIRKAIISYDMWSDKNKLQPEVLDKVCKEVGKGICDKVFKDSK